MKKMSQDRDIFCRELATKKAKICRRLLTKGSIRVIISSMTEFAKKFSITPTAQSALMAIERARGFLEAAVLSDEWIEKMQAKALS